jgi:DsbC/DsbD-like thiol-disulfide interchange protein/cytochrome c biogenesis protein CcdA
MAFFKIFLTLILCGFISPAFAQVYEANAQVSLISEHDMLPNQGTVWVGLHMVVDPEWHIYWRNAGDSGLAPKITWNLPDSVIAGEIQWPYPHRINIDPLTSFGYEGDTLFMVPLTIQKPISAQDIKAHVDWLTCKIECLPGRADLTLLLSDHSVLFKETRAKWPVKDKTINAAAKEQHGHWLIDLKGHLPAFNDIFFYPFRDDVIDHAAKQNLSRVAGGVRLEVLQSTLLKIRPQSLAGVIVMDQKAIEIDAPLTAADSQSPLTFLVACLFAFIGGFILNLMPCVLPVLSLKAISLLKTKDDRRLSYIQGIGFGLGVLASFWVLAGLLLILKAAGHQVGWGFQFQSPLFVVGMAVILLIFALNLLGVFEFNVSFTKKFPQGNSLWVNSFWGGVFATVLATPCTAPFMGTALTFALTQPIAVGLAVFTCLGLGMAMPYMLLSFFPSTLCFIPTPGPWMVALKKFFGIVLLLCVAWLIWVFSLQQGLLKLEKDSIWQTFDQAKVDAALRAGQPVFLDFTAAWCLTCQVNDRTVFRQKPVVDAFKRHNVQAFKGDWTSYDETITKTLNSFGRSSVPLYVFYPAGTTNPVILPELISTDVLLENID